MPAVHFDGYYCSRPVPWEDWHAGVRMHGERLHYRRFFPDGIWLGACREFPFAFWEGSEQLDTLAMESIKRGHGPRDSDANPLWVAGTYQEASGELVQSLCPDAGGGHVWVSRFIVLDDRIVGPNTAPNPLVLLFRPAPAAPQTC